MGGLSKVAKSLIKIRGTADIGMEMPSIGGIPRDRLEQFAQMAAASCASICRGALLANLAAAGIQSENLARAIQKSVPFYYSKRGIVRVRMPAGEVGWKHQGRNGKTYVDKRPEGPYVMQASLDAGSVRGLDAQASRAKRSIKLGAITEKVIGKVVQIHDGRRIVRERIDVGGLAVVRGKSFWKFTPAQQMEIASHFRKNFYGLVRRQLGNK